MRWIVSSPRVQEIQKETRMDLEDAKAQGTSVSVASEMVQTRNVILFFFCWRHIMPTQRRCAMMCDGMTACDTETER